LIIEGHLHAGDLLAAPSHKHPTVAAPAPPEAGPDQVPGHRSTSAISIVSPGGRHA
jgi:hypothetical protein